MKDTFLHFVLGVALALMIGWILIIGRNVILPVTASIVVAYIVFGLSELVGRIPVIGPGLPRPVRGALAVLVTLAVLVGMVWLIVTNLSRVVALVPQYQDQLLRAIQSVAVRFGVETAPNWQILRDEVLGQIDLRRAVAVTVSSAAAIVGTTLVVMIYAGFLLIEQSAFTNKFARMSDDPARVAQIHKVIRDINSRIGTYLAMKTMINIVLGLVSYGIMRVAGIEFAGFWAILIALVNYIPYVGSFVGLVFPVALSILQFGALWPVLIFIAAMASVQILLGNFIEPWLMGSSLNLSPFVILVSLVVWTSIWGIAGAILSVPLMAILVIVFSEFNGTRPIAIMLSRNGEVAQGPRPLV